MYDKGEKDELRDFEQSAYRHAVQNLRKFIVAEARTNALPLNVSAKPSTQRAARRNQKRAT
jgi:hypothetical protein